MTFNCSRDSRFTLDHKQSKTIDATFHREYAYAFPKFHIGIIIII